MPATPTSSANPSTVQRFTNWWPASKAGNRQNGSSRGNRRWCRQNEVQTRSGTAACGEGVEIFYEDLGDPAAPPVLLIMGVGAQLPMWPDGFCARLVERGYRVIRFDHRDTG